MLGTYTCLMVDAKAYIIVTRLLEEDEDCRMLTEKSSNGDYMLNYAAKQKDVEMVRLLLHTTHSSMGAAVRQALQDATVMASSIFVPEMIAHILLQPALLITWTAPHGHIQGNCIGFLTHGWNLALIVLLVNRANGSRGGYPRALGGHRVVVAQPPCALPPWSWYPVVHLVVGLAFHF
jgi:hypothetical protein